MKIALNNKTVETVPGTNLKVPNYNIIRKKIIDGWYLIKIGTTYAKNRTLTKVELRDFQMASNPAQALVSSSELIDYAAGDCLLAKLKVKSKEPEQLVVCLIEESYPIGEKVEISF